MTTRATLMGRTIKAVTVEYDGPKGKRMHRTFDGHSAVSGSRRLYAQKLKAGKNPRVVSAVR